MAGEERNREGAPVLAQRCWYVHMCNWCIHRPFSMRAEGLSGRANQRGGKGRPPHPRHSLCFRCVASPRAGCRGRGTDASRHRRRAQGHVSMWQAVWVAGGKTPVGSKKWAYYRGSRDCLSWSVATRPPTTGRQVSMCPVGVIELRNKYCNTFATCTHTWTCTVAHSPESRGTYE